MALADTMQQSRSALPYCFLTYARLMRQGAMIQISNKIKICKFPFVFLFFYSLFFIVKTSYGLEEKKLIYINSYSTGYEWGDRQEDGFFKAFEESKLAEQGWVIKKFYLDEKNKFKTEEIKKSVQNVTKQLDEITADAAFLADDPAFKYFLHYFRQKNVPVGFSGVQGNLNDYGYKIGDTGVTGSLEHYNMPSVVRLLKKIKPSIDSILFVCDDNISGRAHTKSFLEQTQNNKSLTDIGVTKFFAYASNNYENLIATLKKVDTTKTAVIMAS